MGMEDGRAIEMDAFVDWNGLGVQNVDAIATGQRQRHRVIVF